MLTGGVGLDNPITKPADWMTTQCWDEIVRLTSYPTYTELHQSVASNLQGWKAFYDSNNPENEDIPEPWSSKLSRFQKMVLLRCFRPDKLVPTVTNFVEG